MDIKLILKNIYAVSKTLNIPAYVVGGFVRDALLGIPHTKDIDIVVEGSGVAFAKAFEEVMKAVGHDGTLVEFPEFDTARYVIGLRTSDYGLRTTDLSRSDLAVAEVRSQKSEVQIEIEFAGARSESYRSASRKPEVIPATLEQDLSRRDFTVNAMAQKIMASGISKTVIDPFGGKNDVKEGLLRTPLAPDETFSDDPLRMLRAARFAAQLNFHIDEETLLAMKRNASRLRIISAERILEELMKTLATRQPSLGLWILERTGLMQEFLLEVSALAGVEEVFGYRHKDNLSHTFAVVDNIAEQSEKPVLRFAGLMHDIAKPKTKKFVRGRGWTFDMHEHLGRKMARSIGRRLRMSTDDIEYVATLVRWHLQPIALMDEGITDSAVRRLIVTLGETLADLLMLCRGDITTGNQNKKVRRLKNYDMLETRIADVMEKDKLRAFQSPVRGEEIMEVCGLKPGPTVGKIKEAIEEAILDGKIPNEYDAAKKYFEEIRGEYLEKAEEWEKVGVLIGDT
ncbi:MAG: HD domain-containing protein [Patescibacteria group bacterium]